MQTKAKIVSLLLVSSIGLLFGKNVLADGVQLQSSSAQNISAQIEVIRQKINELSVQLNQKKSEQSSIAATGSQLTQEKIDYIEAEVSRIAVETAQVKIEVEIFVTVREIQRKVVALSAQITSASQSPMAYVYPPVTELSLDEKKRQDIEIQVAKITQQINELNQELRIQKNIEQTQSAPGQCRGDSCSVSASDSSNSAAPIVVQSTPKKETAQSENKGFWQSVGDFFKKIFSF